jgi:hypothetical protein
MAQASNLVDGGYLYAAVVLSSAVLEEQLRTMCRTRGLKIKKLGLAAYSDALIKAGAYDRATHSLIDAVRLRRNQAAHGERATFTEPEVREQIAFVGRLVHDFS